MTTPQDIQAVYERSTQLFTAEEVQQALEQMAKKITAQLHDTNPLVLCVMNGAIVVTGHLVTRLDFLLEMDYVHATRYRGKTKGNQLHWYKKPNTSLAGRTILLVDDILDGGITLAEIVNHCKQQGAQAVYTAVLLDKYQKRLPEGLDHADFVGLSVEDYYTFGFGMDYHEYLRNVPGIYGVAAEDQ